MIIECPHCYERVLPQQDGTCPNCRRNTQILGGSRHELTKVDIKQSYSLPDVCFKCGEKSDSFVIIKRSHSTSKESPIVKIIVLIFSPFAFLMNNGFGSGRYTVIKITMPICTKCKSAEKIEPVHIDFDNYTMSFITHYKFKEELIKKLNV
ncbi:MAG: hypothetical protein ACOYWZ_15775 [Bacillota bacterium]